MSFDSYLEGLAKSLGIDTSEASDLNPDDVKVKVLCAKIHEECLRDLLMRMLSFQLSKAKTAEAKELYQTLISHHRKTSHAAMTSFWVGYYRSQKDEEQREILRKTFDKWGAYCQQSTH